MARSRQLPEPDLTMLARVALWERENGRQYPWRLSHNPFHVLTAEVFLQRTRADQVLDVYQDFVRTVAGPQDVVRGGKEQVDSWFGSLGLRWRADHYWQLCRELVEEYSGEVPADRGSLMRLPGVGQYVAGALRTYAFGAPTGVIDSNILRIYGRYYQIDFGDADRRAAAVLEWAQDHMPEDPAFAREFSFGLLDLGATICRPQGPDCPACPLREACRFTVEAGSDS